MFVGNLDDKVTERVLYEIMIQAGPLVDVYMPRDKETKRHRGYGFAEFTTEKSAQYAVSLFSGLVSLYKKSLRFSISGQDKQSPGQDKPSQDQEVNVLLYNSHLESSSGSLRNHSLPQTPPVGYSNLSAINGFPGSVLDGQRLNFPPVARAQNYNANLVSLGEMGLRSQLQSREYAYVHPYY